MILICLSGGMHLDQIHILRRKDGVSGYLFWYIYVYFTFLCYFILKLWFCHNMFFIYWIFLQTFLWEAWQDLTLIILIIAAAVSLVLGIKTEVWLFFLFLYLLIFLNWEVLILPENLCSLGPTCFIYVLLVQSARFPRWVWF